MRGFIFLEFLVAAFLLLSTLTLIFGLCQSSTDAVSDNFLYFSALTAKKSYLNWQIAGAEVLPPEFKRSIRYLPNVQISGGNDAKICWKYLGKASCVA
jgi:hypothetical protein